MEEQRFLYQHIHGTVLTFASIAFPWRCLLICSACLGQARKAIEVRWPLLKVGLLAFLPLGALVEQQRGCSTQLLQTGLSILGGVEGSLAHAQRGGAVTQHLAAQALCGRCQLGKGHYLIDEAPLQRGRCVVHAAREPHLTRPLLANQARHLGAPVASIKGANFGARLSKHRVVGSNRKVAHHVQDMAAADGVAGNHRDHGLGQAPDLDLKVQHIQPWHAVIAHVTAVPAHHLVAATAECQLACACVALDGAKVTNFVTSMCGTLRQRRTCQNDATDTRVVAGVSETPGHLLHCRR